MHMLKRDQREDALAQSPVSALGNNLIHRMELISFLFERENENREANERIAIMKFIPSRLDEHESRRNERRRAFDAILFNNSGNSIPCLTVSSQEELNFPFDLIQ